MRAGWRTRQIHVDPPRSGARLTDDEAELREMSDFIKSLGSVRRVEVLPYHTLGLFKWEKLGITYSLDGVQPPSEEAVQRAEELLCIKDYPDFKK